MSVVWCQRSLRRAYHLLRGVLAILITPHAGGLEQRKESQSIFRVSAKLWFRSDVHIWLPS